MSATRRAVIDVGTNSVKLLVAEVLGGSVAPVHEEGRQTRLGHGFYQTRMLQPAALQATALAVRDFAATAAQLHAAQPRVIATSAARDALNADELREAIRAAAGLDLEVISGDQEARWSFAGACTHPDWATRPVLLLDTGGGSTEFIVGSSGRSHFHQSFQLGAVRLAEAILVSDPPSPGEFAQCREHLRALLANDIAPLVRPALAHEPAGVALLATGGSASVLAMMAAGLRRFDRARIEEEILTAAAIRGWTEQLWQLPLAERRKLPGLPPERADIMPFGVAIFEAVMSAFQLSPLRVNTRGLRFGALLEPTA